MTTATVQSRVNLELKKQAEVLFAAIGMSTADAIRIFLQQSVNDGGLPFRPALRQPNAQTLEAMEELEGGRGIRYKNSKEMYEDLGI